MNVSASLTKSIFHCGKAGRRGAFIAASTKRMRASMALSRNQMTCQATERQATFLGKTEPRAARPEGPVAGVNSRPARARDCQHTRFCIARRPHCRRSKRAVASNHEGEWRILHRAPRRAGRRRHAARPAFFSAAFSLRSNSFSMLLRIKPTRTSPISDCKTASIRTSNAATTRRATGVRFRDPPLVR
jgi:hypothetical protein